jgi:LmbE family N-acetylglucosaminyl deacetylase
MLPLGLPEVRTLLCIGAHCDDIEIGCGGLLADLSAARLGLRVIIAVLSSDDARRRESQEACQALCASGTKFSFHFFGFRDGHLPAFWSQAKDAVESLHSICEPDLILTHSESDRHQDHEIVGRLVWTAFRSQLILGFEIPKFDGDLAQPNVYFPLSAEGARRKLEVLDGGFATQRAKPWYRRQTFEALLALRAVECRSPTGYAEAFQGRKLTLRV